MPVKTAEEIRQIRAGGAILGRILSHLAKMCQPGISTHEIDAQAEKMINEAGGRPSFKGFKSMPSDTPFPCTICASLNHELVHGRARKGVFLKEGDIFSIDIGMEWPYAKGKQKGYFTDTAITVAVGKIPEKTRHLLRVTKHALEAGIKACKPGKTVADIGGAIEDYVKSQGKYGIVRDLVGHGVGYAVHEDPRIPNFYDREMESWMLRPGMVIAIEPMISLGDYKVKMAEDGWTIVMADNSLCAHFEHTVAITKNGPEVLTRRPREKEEKI